MKTTLTETQISLVGKEIVLLELFPPHKIDENKAYAPENNFNKGFNPKAQVLTFLKSQNTSPSKTRGLAVVTLAARENRERSFSSLKLLTFIHSSKIHNELC